MPAEQLASLLHAHPERQRLSRSSPEVHAKQESLVARLRGPDLDAELEHRLADLPVPTLVLFGTVDRMIPPEMGRVYRATLPNCHFVLVYDAGHAIAVDRPQAFASLVSDFLERREQFVVSRAITAVHP